MLDFVWISTRRKSSSRVEVYPKFLMGKTEDLMIRASDFYAFWDESKSLWSTDEDDLYIIIDRLITEAADAYQSAHPSEAVIPLYMKDSDSGSVDKWHKYCQKQRRDSYHNLDAKIIFANTETKKEDYASRKLSYPIEERETPAYEEVISTLYLPPERHKIEWAIGAIISGDSKKIQKFLAMYGEPGSGKGTIINIISQLFEGYCKSFEARILGLATAAFPLEAIKDNPLVAFDSDANLSGIEDNTRLNALISHEVMPVNTKNHSIYTTKFNTFVILGTNKPVRITDARSGIIRRLIDVRPSNQTIPEQRYEQLMKQIEFELGGIAYHCLEVYKEAPRYYSKYVPTDMISASNDFYNFVLDSYDVFKRDDSTTLKAAYEMYKVYCDDARVPYPYSQRVFKEELKTYFKSFEERATTEDANGVRPRNLYKGFIATKFMNVLDASDPVKEEENSTDEKPEKPKVLELNCTVSLFDDIYKDCPAQYGLEDQNERPTYKWENVKTRLKDLDTSKLHYVKVPENLIVIDLDLKDSEGNKSFELNSEAAALFPPTYAELSKGGQGVHLHYIYNGDVDKLSRVYDDQIEVKVFTGNSSLRRRLNKCNDIPVAQISSGLPLKEDNKKVIDFEGFKNEKAIRTYVKRCLNKEYANSTRQSMSLLHDTLEKAYDSGVKYDISDMASAILTFAKRSTNSAQFCYELAGKLKLKSAEELSENFEKYDSDTLVFFDCEVFSNLFVVVYMADGKEPVKLINPSPADISELMKFRLIGFNCRDYDNHILYARMLGENNQQLFNRSVSIINKGRDAKIGKAYNVSYTDVYDFASKKQSLKKWEIELGIHHQELNHPWDQPVPEDKWEEVADYCANDVIATAALFHHLTEDWKARQILADLAGATVNDTTNTLTTKIVFGNERNPQLVYTDLATGEQSVGR